MGLINCPDCKRQVSDQAPHCVGCGRPLGAAPARTQTNSASIGKCPACNSSNTYDRIENARSQGGLAQALGASLGGWFAKKGRYVCANCGHSWEFGAKS